MGTDLSGLTLLYLNENKLQGTIPESFCQIGDSLTSLSLASNELSGMWLPCTCALR